MMKNNKLDKNKKIGNFTFEKNNEIYNKHIFDRNLQNVHYLSRPNLNPTYFDNNHYSNRNNAEQIYNNRNVTSREMKGSSYLGYVDFSDKKTNTIEFKKNYDDYMNKKY